MTSKTFTSGTVIDSAWLNDVNSATYSGGAIYTPAGTGAVATTVQTKLRESVSVKDFGAVGDGVTDDTAAIQLALNSVSGTKGKTVTAEDGTRISVTPSYVATGVTQFEDLTWPTNANVEYSGPTRESVQHMNNISDPYQVIAVTTTAWAALTAYSIGNKVVNGGNAYYCTVAGTSAAVGGPSGTGSTIVDGTVTWKYITNGLYSGVPVNEQRYSAPYHTGLVLDNKTSASYGGVSQPAHDIAAAIVAAGGNDTSQYKSIVFSKDGNTHWQQVSDGITSDLSFHHWTTGLTQQLWRLHFSGTYGDIGIQRSTAEYPLDVAGKMRLMQDVSTDTPVQGDNRTRFPGRPSFVFQYKNNSIDYTSTIQLEGATGYQIGLNAPNVSGQAGAVQFTAGDGSSNLRSVIFEGLYNGWNPGVDNVTALGRTAKRWSVVYAGTGTINTSDAREKQQIRSLSDAEKAVAVRLKGMIKAFKFTDAVALKGDGARIHFGVIAQEVKEAFEAQGLVAESYAILCFDEWVAEPEGKDEDGNTTKQAIIAGNRYGVRYEELLAFIIAAL